MIWRKNLVTPSLDIATKPVAARRARKGGRLSWGGLRYPKDSAEVPVILLLGVSFMILYFDIWGHRVGRHTLWYSLYTCTLCLRCMSWYVVTNTLYYRTVLTVLFDNHLYGWLLTYSSFDSLGVSQLFLIRRPPLSVCELKRINCKFNISVSPPENGHFDIQMAHGQAQSYRISWQRIFFCTYVKGTI